MYGLRYRKMNESTRYDMRTNRAHRRRLRHRLTWSRATIIFIRMYLKIAFAVAGCVVIVMILPMLLCERLCRLGRRSKVSADSMEEMQ